MKQRWNRVASFALTATAAVLGCQAVEVSEASAQEIQLTGPLAGASSVRKLRLRRDDRFEVTPNVSFSLLDEYQRTIMPGLRAQWHPFDWLGLGVWGGYGFQYTTGLTDQLQEKAVNERDCGGNPAKKECRLTAVNLTQGDLSDDQLGTLTWVGALEANFIPFRGKVALFSSLFVDTDINLFVGPALVGVRERAECGGESAACATSFELVDRVDFAPTFGVGLNFYPTNLFGFGAEWRGLVPVSGYNTSGFDKYGGGPDGDFPDNKVNSDDREVVFNSMISVNFIFRFPDVVVSE
jgi:hypothetical protein